MVSFVNLFYRMAQEAINPSIVNTTVTNVVNTALNFGVRHVVFWEMFDNEVCHMYR